MTLVGEQAAPEAPQDPAYPTTTPPDPIYPCQTRAPLGAPFDGVILPALWSRIAHPLERCLTRLHDGLGLLPRVGPAHPVALHYGRIAVNAHAWERLRAGAIGEAADPTLVGPAARGWQRLLDSRERLRVRFSSRQLQTRLERSFTGCETLLQRAADREPGDLDAAELARGALGGHAWTELLLPLLGLPLFGGDPEQWRTIARQALLLEDRFALELGRRLADNRMLDHADDVAYLTIEERVRAALESSPFWSKLAARRQQRVEQFVSLDVPLVFWGRPRVDVEKTG
jgi:hypothetical protein